MGTESKLPSIGVAPAEVAVVQVREDLTTVFRIKVIAQAAIVQDCWTCEPLIGPSAGPKPGPAVKRIRERLGRAMDVTLVFNSATVSSLVQKAPVSTEGLIRAHVQHAVLQQHKIDLSKCYWTITPLSYRFDDQRGLTEALSNKLNVLICTAPKPTVHGLHAAFEKEGFQVVQTLFPVPALTKAFDQFGGQTFDSQMIGLLHVRDKNYSLAVYRSGGLLSYAESKRELAAAEIAAEVKDHITAFQAKYKTALRCVFVSSDSGEDQQVVDALKAVGTYARTWNACRKLSFAAGANAELTSGKGSRYNVLAGGASAAVDAIANPVVHDDNDDPDPLGDESDSLIIARPFAVAACLLLLPLWFLMHQNATLEERVKAADLRYQSEQKKIEQNAPPARNCGRSSRT